VLVLRCGSAGVVWYPYAGFSAAVNCEKLMLSKYFALLLLGFILTEQPLGFKQSQIWLSKQLGKNGYQNATA